MIDSYRHKGLRKKLVSVLRLKGIKDPSILEAIGTIPRHFFLDNAFDDWAYKDVAFPIDANQTISQPYTVAYQTTLLQVTKKDTILEIGTGSGYQACVLSFLGAKVYSIERQRDLFIKTEKKLKALGYGRIRTVFGDGYKGLKQFAPFTKILVTAGAEHIPGNLLEQLAVGGIMVIPVGKEGNQKMIRILKISEDNYQQEELGDFRFVPFLNGVQK